MCALLAEKLRSAGSSMRKPGGNSFKESNVEKGMILPFTPLTMTFHDVHYFVDCPSVCQSDAPYHISARTSNLVFLIHTASIHHGSNAICVRTDKLCLHKLSVCATIGLICWQLI